MEHLARDASKDVRGQKTIYLHPKPCNLAALNFLIKISHSLTVHPTFNTNFYCNQTSLFDDTIACRIQSVIKLAIVCI